MLDKAAAVPLRARSGAGLRCDEGGYDICRRDQEHGAVYRFDSWNWIPSLNTVRFTSSEYGRSSVFLAPMNTAGSYEITRVPAVAL